MATTQEMTETPDWTPEEEVMCAKILDEVQKGRVKLFQVR